MNGCVLVDVEILRREIEHMIETLASQELHSDGSFVISEYHYAKNALVCIAVASYWRVELVTLITEGSMRSSMSLA